MSNCFFSFRVVFQFNYRNGSERERARVMERDRRGETILTLFCPVFVPALFLLAKKKKKKKKLFLFRPPPPALPLEPRGALQQLRPPGHPPRPPGPCGSFI